MVNDFVNSNSVKGKVKNKKVKAYLCPNCKSVNVKFVFGLRNAFGVIPKMRCLDCKTEMPSFPIVAINKSGINKSINNKPMKKVESVVGKKVIKKNGVKKK